MHKCDDGYAYTSPAGAFQSNDFVLYDMLGNAWEWCEEWHDGSYYDKSPMNNPKGLSNGRYRVLRGSFWLSNPRDLLCANRSREAPFGRTDTYGFRLVVTHSD